MGMITFTKLRIYEKYSGDADGWARTRNSEEMSLMNDADWYQIKVLVHRISLVKARLASPALTVDVQEEMRQDVEDDDTRKLLCEIADQHLRDSQSI
jgi:hypothetical protein